MIKNSVLPDRRTIYSESVKLYCGIDWDSGELGGQNALCFREVLDHQPVKRVVLDGDIWPPVARFWAVTKVLHGSRRRRESYDKSMF